MNCDICKSHLPSDGDFVTCGNCKNSLHFNCSGQQKSTWKAKSAKKKSEWECANCRAAHSKKSRTNSVDIEDDIEPEDPNYLALKKLLEKMFQRQEDKITQRVENIISIVGKLEDLINGMIERVKEIEDRSNELRNEVDDLRLELEAEKQYGRSRNFIVTSIPHSDKEDVPEKICELLKAMNINMKKEDITAHRLPSPKSPAAIIVQCTTRTIRDNIVRRARKYKPKTSLINNVQLERSIYFNDHLTPYFSDLMKKAKEIKDKKGFRFIWLNGNKIMLRKDNQSRVFKIQKLSDLDKVE